MFLLRQALAFCALLLASGISQAGDAATFHVHALAYLAEGGPVMERDAPVHWAFFRLGDDGRRSPEPVAEGDGGEAEFSLPAGIHVGVASLGALRNELLVEPEGDHGVVAEMIFDAGILTVTPVLEGSGETLPDARIEMIYVGGQDKGTGPTTRYVGAGSVEVHAVSAGANVRKDIPVNAGARVETTITVPAGT